MDHFYVLILLGLAIGFLGTLIGAGGGFILVPILVIFRPDLSPESISAISMAVVAFNALSGSAAYMVQRRVDYKAGIIFALLTVPGSILGVLTTQVVDRSTFDIAFGIILFAMAVFLFVRGGKKTSGQVLTVKKGWISQKLTDRAGETYQYAYDVKKGGILSVAVGYFSPLLGIGGGIIHVPAMVEWLRFPVHIATATSHFILAIMASVSVAVHYYEGSYDVPEITHMVFGLALGIVPGAQLGAYLSGKLNGKVIIRALSLALMLVGLRILLSRFF